MSGKGAGATFERKGPNFLRCLRYPYERAAEREESNARRSGTMTSIVGVATETSEANE